MSDTPRTDAWLMREFDERPGKPISASECVAFAGTLERENAELLQDKAELVIALGTMIRMFDKEIHNEYDGTNMLKYRLAEANDCRAALAKHGAQQ